MNVIKIAGLAGVAALASSTAAAWDLSLGGQNLEFHGFASQGFLASSDYDYLTSSRDGSFSFNEFGINASISPFKRTRIMAQGFAYELGDFGDYRPFLDYASVEYTFHETFGIRAGRVRRPRGIYNHIQDLDMARTSVLLPQGLYDARWRDFATSIDGGLLFGHLPAGGAGSFSYEAYLGATYLSNDGGIGSQIQNALPPAPIGVLHSLDTVLNMGLQVWWYTRIPGLRAGVSTGYAPEITAHYSIDPPYGPGRMEMELDVGFHQLSLEYLWRAWTFQAEYAFTTVHSRNSAGGMTVEEDTIRSDAWYVGASYRFKPWLEVGAYYTEYYAEISDRSGRDRLVRSDAYQRDTALSFRFDIRDWWLVKLEGHYLRGTALLHDDARNPVRDESGWWMFGAKTTVTF